MENNKKILIGVGVLAAVGLAYYLWKKKESSETTVTGGEKKPEEKVNAIGISNRYAQKRVVAPINVPLGRVHAWGHKVVDKRKQCWDDSISKYVDCGTVQKRN